MTVEATGATITGGISLEFELTDTPLNELEHNITALDEFGTSITDIVLTEISPGDYTVGDRLDSLAQLPDGQTYTFIYQITDYRGVMVEQVRNVSIVVTAPELIVPDFQSEVDLHPSENRMKRMLLSTKTLGENCPTGFHQSVRSILIMNLSQV